MKKQLILLTLLLTTQLFAMEKDNPYSYQTSQSSSKMDIERSFQSSQMDEEKQDLVSKKKNEIRSWIENLEHELIKDFGELADSNGWLTQLQNLRNELNPSKKSILNTIRKNTKNNEIIKNYCLDIGDSLTDLPHLMLKNRIKEYFKNEAKIGTVFGIDEKKEGNGRQLGAVIKVKTYTYNDVLQFYVKTHQYGLLSQTMTSAAKPVDLKELFAYKFLNLCGITPEVHFFYDDSVNFYIATKNDGYSQSGSTEFVTYDKAIKDESFSKINKEVLQGSFELADFYSRVMVLEDVLTNSGNFGFIWDKESGYENTKFKLVDFQAPGSKVSYKLNGNLFGGWETANGSYKYSDQIYEVLNVDLNTKKKVIKPLLHSVEKIKNYIDQSSHEVKTIVTKLYSKETDRDKNLKDLNNYTEAVLYHYNDLYTKIDEYNSD
jgi:hypothetical protein